MKRELSITFRISPQPHWGTQCLNQWPVAISAYIIRSGLTGLLICSKL